MAGEKLGVVAAAEAVAGETGGGPPGAEAEQLELLPLPLDSAGAPTTGGRGGRPAGSRNRRTAEWIDWLLGRHRSPLEVLAAAYSLPVEELARRLGCDRLEAFRVQMDAAKALAPYLHQRLPIAVQVDQRSVHLVIQEGAGADAGDVADDTVGLSIDIGENQ